MEPWAWACSKCGAKNGAELTVCPECGNFSVYGTIDSLKKRIAELERRMQKHENEA